MEFEAFLNYDAGELQLSVNIMPEGLPKVWMEGGAFSNLDEFLLATIEVNGLTYPLHKYLEDRIPPDVYRDIYCFWFDRMATVH